MPCSSAQRPDGLDLFGGGHRTGRVGRRAPQQHLRALGARGLELLDGDAVALVLGRHDVDRHAAGELHGLRVRGPVGRGEQDLVARVEQGREGLVDRLLAAVGDQHLARGDVEAAVALGLGGDRVLELRQPPGGGVAVVHGVLAGRRSGLDDRGGRGEVGLPGTEADDVLAGGLLGLRLGVDGKGGGLGDAADALRDAAGGSGGAGVMRPSSQGGQPACCRGARWGSRAARWEPGGSALHWSAWGQVPLLRRARAAGRRRPIPRGVAQLARAPVSKTGCRRFDSCHPCQPDRAPPARASTQQSTQQSTQPRPPREGRP